MYNKYAWYKEFGCPVDVDLLPAHEVDAVNMIRAQINECKMERDKRNMPKVPTR